MAVKKSELAERLDSVRERIAAACARAKRPVSDVTLIAVTKNAVPEQIREIISLGVTDLGESRVQVLAQRGAQINEFFQRRVQLGDLPLMPRIRWHMIGHLQRNKIKQILPIVSVVHSIDSLRLAEELEIQLAKTPSAKRLPVMLQVNASEEKSKFGVAVGAALHLAEQIDTMPALQLVGLMAMAPLTDKPDETRAVFTRMREIFEELKWHKIGGSSLKHLSMGMSNDFETAIEEGATMIRIGTDLFGAPANPDPADDRE
ncbi:MAG TPA: YggS family pyridoxal phosphate-dependent enzyme [Tepidisphaeraceae bacterium]|nr:YggS family pyridoxal phosphate-dependent enzyme [Tepidisphaeraceae bacterium]